MFDCLRGRLLSARTLRTLMYWSSTKFTVGSMVIWVAGDQVLLVRSRFGERAWGFPGGSMSRREDPLDCAVRELREETGVDVASDELALVGSHTQRHARHVDNVYRLSRAPGELVGFGGGGDRFEIAEVRWWPTGRLPKMRREAVHVVERYADVLASDGADGR
jgi:ADP-ribose pyrophosphatase YjhB (NUDIX family)